jgi:nanoRNase/pAp phosphatase (c-di-AMP/oligoRNAs hydrolase)
MKKIILFISICFLFASTEEEFLDYTNKLVNYSFKLKNFDKIKSPFFKKEKKPVSQEIKKKNRKIINISLLSVLNNLAYVKIEIFKEDALIKSYKKWVEVGNYIDECKLTHIYTDKIILDCNKKILIKSLNEKTLRIRIEK